jgi:iron complex transport system substrate-binding protein
VNRSLLPLLAFAWLCLVTDPARAENLTVTDMAGREVTLCSQPRRIVCLGPGALRLLVYLQATDRLVGVEELEKRRPGGRPYALAHPELARLPGVGPGGPSSVIAKPDLEAILKARPQVIFVSYLEGSAADALQDTLGIPVVALRYGRSLSLDETVFDSIALAGKVLGEQERARRLLRYVKSLRADLDERTRDLPPRLRASAYIGGVGFRGVHGIESTEKGYLPMLWSHVDNAVEPVQARLGSHVFLDKEMLLALDPQTIFLDAAGLALIEEDYRNHADFYRALGAFQKGRVFVLFPFNAYATNIETALVDAYAVGKTLYPERFKDVDLKKKADEIYRFFVGAAVTGAMEKEFGRLGSAAPFWREPESVTGR